MAKSVLTRAPRDQHPAAGGGAADAPAESASAPGPAAAPKAAKSRATRSDAGSGRSTNPDYAQLGVWIPKAMRTQINVMAASDDNLTAGDIVEAALDAYLPPRD